MKDKSALPPPGNKSGPGEFGSREFRVPPEEAGVRLDRYLARKFPLFSREAWRRRLRTGDVLLDGKQVAPAKIIRPGQTIWYRFPVKPEPEVNTHLGFLYQDEHLLVVDKPANLPVHPSGVYRTRSLTSLLKQNYPRFSDARLVHRLDRETSGVLVLARSRAAAAGLHHQFLSGSITKTYLVIVYGQFPRKRDATGWIGPGSGTPVRKQRRFVPAGPENQPPGAGFQSCRTVFTRLATNERFSLLRARLFTGRTHQIRATLRDCGFPVVGDTLYGPNPRYYLDFVDDTLTEEARRELVLSRSALHCAEMGFRHPQSNRELIITSPPPPDFQALFPDWTPSAVQSSPSIGGGDHYGPE